jgi:uncharacterized protein YbjT (DUF2867 family)
MPAKTVAIAGGSGFIGRTIARRLAAIGEIKVRVITRNPDAAYERLKVQGVQFVRGDVGDPATLKDALAGSDAIVDAVQFDGYPVENPRRGLTFERVDYGGAVELIEAATQAGVTQFIYISGASADEYSAHPAFCAKGRAERAIRDSGLTYTIFRPSLVYGPEDKVVNGLARAMRFTPVFGVPGTGRQWVQPVLVDDLAACVALAVSGRGRNQIYEIGGPDLMTFDQMMHAIMNASRRRRLLFHIPENVMRAVGGLLEKLPKPLLSRDAVTFVTADNACDNQLLLKEFGITLTPARVGMAYLSKK